MEPMPPPIFPNGAGVIATMNLPPIDTSDPIGMIVYIILWIIALYVFTPIFIEVGKDIYNAIVTRVHKLIGFFSSKKR